MVKEGDIIRILVPFQEVDSDWFFLGMFMRGSLEQRITHIIKPLYDDVCTKVHAFNKNELAQITHIFTWENIEYGLIKLRSCGKIHAIVAGSGLPDFQLDVIETLKHIKTNAR